ncbi:LOW QUALITY PROTEIN: mRNA decay activator protein ZFP36 [Alosa sapidissima]|uniref:LOW QUALITY PROTEIN: mRNA decay activator protein ZFP36 n=1 Tax=Alosa sapidissima TaxID=34773 RepID=UPI001C08B6A4|nr:LOW QUALITY PROTEIN: mRNA decay activator protein ZFP36 [Alosa sapidissima]
MPSYALNQFIDLDEVLCKQLLSLDLREPPKMSALPVSPVGHKKIRPSCSFSSSSSSCLSDSKVNAAGTTGHWGQPADIPLPSNWNKMSFWAERSVSMVEGSTSSLGWASTEPGSCKPASASSCTSLPSVSMAASTAASTTSSRYKTELCRTYAERGMCKYGSKCQFAHGLEELRDLNRHPKYKTEPCRTFHSVGFCPYGIRCHFVHNNEDDDHAHAHTRPKQFSSSSSTGRVPSQRPPLLKQSFSFAGFPSNHPPPAMDPTLPHAYLRAPSLSPPASSDLSELLSLAFHDVDVASASLVAAAAAATAAALEASVCDPQPQFLPSPDSGCSSCSLASSSALPPPHTQPAGAGREVPAAEPNRRPRGHADRRLLLLHCQGVRSLSHTSLSDHEGGCGSSASSLSGSDSCASGFEGVGKRLPIFSQLSVPDDGFFSEGSSTGFFL